MRSITARQKEQERMLEQGLQYVDKFINKNYLIGLNVFPIVETQNSIEQYSGVRLFHIKKIIYNETDDMNGLLTSVYSALHSISASAIVLINAQLDSVDFYIGISSDKDSSVAGTILAKGIKGNFPGSDFDSLPGSDVKKILKNISNHSITNLTSVSVVPTIRGEKDKYVQGFEKLIEALKGETYTAVFISEPVTQSDVQQRKQGFEQLYTTLFPLQKTSLQYGENSSESISEGISEGFSKSINSAVSDTNTDSKSNSTSKSTGNSSGFSYGSSKGASSNYSYPGGYYSTGNSDQSNFGVNWGSNTSSGSSFSTSTSWGHSVTQGETFTDTKQTNTNNSTTVGDSNSLTINYENKTISNILDHISDHLERIIENEIYGWWLSGGYFISESIQTAVVAANTYRALMTGDESQVENAYINIWDSTQRSTIDKMLAYIKCGKHPIFEIPSIGEFGKQYVKPVQMISGKEIPIFSGFPRTSVSGIIIDSMASFGQEVLTLSGKKPDANFPLGRVVNKGIVENVRIDLDMEAFRAHCFITGSTGSGKSNTVYRLLDNFIEKNVKFLIIEPAKGEYKYVYGKLKDTNIFWTNPTVYPMLHINPFSFPDNIHILEHLDRLIEIFSACWPLYGAMPAILKKSVERAYVERGWDLVRSINIVREKNKFPTFAELLEIMPKVINESSYSAQAKGDYTGALVTRVESLANGIMGQVFCSSIETPLETLFDMNTIIDLSRVGAAETKSLLMGILVMKLNEHRISSATNEDVPLRHVTVLEEAHNLLRNSSTTSGSAEGVNVMGKSVEMISNSIAEMRTYGEGFIIVDQSPTAVDISAIKNTNTKIVMRLPEKGDQETVGNSFALSPEQIREISRLDIGMAVVAQNGWLEPVLVKVDAATKLYYGREDMHPSDRERRITLGNLASELIHQYEDIKGDDDATFSSGALRRIIRDSTFSTRKKQEYYKKIESFVTGSTNAVYLSEFLMEILECKGLFDIVPLRLSKNSEMTEDDYNIKKQWQKRICDMFDKYVLLPEPVSHEKMQLLRYLCVSLARSKNYPGITKGMRK